VRAQFGQLEPTSIAIGSFGSNTPSSDLNPAVDFAKENEKHESSALSARYSVWKAIVALASMIDHSLLYVVSSSRSSSP
jgi:hypothetical protein